jgi:hypothetical protein
VKKFISVAAMLVAVGVGLAAWQVASAVAPDTVESTTAKVVESYRASSSYTPDGVSVLTNGPAIGTSRSAMFTPDGVSFLPIVAAKSVAPTRPALPSYIGSGAYTPDGVSSLDNVVGSIRQGSFTPDGVSRILRP